MSPVPLERQSTIMPSIDSQFATPKTSVEVVNGDLTIKSSTAMNIKTMEAQSQETGGFVDIEHIPVVDDPRKWSSLRKHFTLVLIASASMISGLANSIENPAAQDIISQLNATSSQFSLTLSLFILLHGVLSFFWSSISEIKGRKVVYIISLLLFTIASVVASLSQSIYLLIGCRCFQAIGSSAVINLGAATLADIFEPAERGTKMGIYYVAPQLGPALGPVFGGVLTFAFTWRASFWFLSFLGGICTFLFVFCFRDSYRRERSLIYQGIVRKRLLDLRKRQEHESKEGKNDVDLHDIRLTFKDAFHIKAQIIVLRRWNNLIILVSSALQFTFGFLLSYTTSRALSRDYDYGSMHIGLILLSFGFGCVVGSLAGGRWSDRELAQLRRANGGVCYPEMRLRSTWLGALFLPPCIVGLGWACQMKLHPAVISVLLFLCGFFSIWQYASTLAYFVDANVGRSSSAIAANSFFRGVSAFVATEVGVPLQDKLGNGWLGVIWALAMTFSSLLVFTVYMKGRGWRSVAEEREAQAYEPESPPRTSPQSASIHSTETDATAA
ncbi:hypothetical protein AX16_004129 [Volvariella volvacea WC 439]|nr:hypothetical protein AX16_004129 [Volvariella volvacea WC 439]